MATEASESVVSTQALRYCSFCHKSENDVVMLVASEPAFICDDCVFLSLAVVQEHEVIRRFRRALAPRNSALGGRETDAETQPGAADA